MIENKKVEKIKKIREELEKGLVGTNKESLFFDYFKLHSIPLLADQMGLKKILEIINEKSQGKISWREVIGQRRGQITTANSEPELFAPTPVGVEIHVEDPAKIDEYFSSILKGSEVENSEIEILSLHINKHEDDSRITVIINENYSEEKVQPLAKKERWKTLIEIAENGSVETNNVKETKSITDYFNTNKKCMIYARYPKYKLTTILKMDEQQIFPSIKIEMVSSRAFAQRKNKKT